MKPNWFETFAKMLFPISQAVKSLDILASAMYTTNALLQKQKKRGVWIGVGKGLLGRRLKECKGRKSKKQWLNSFSFTHRDCQKLHFSRNLKGQDKLMHILDTHTNDQNSKFNESPQSC